MSVFKQIALTNRPLFNKLRRQFQAEQRMLTREFLEYSEEQLAEFAAAKSCKTPPVAAWHSRNYMAQLYIDHVAGGTPDDETFHRLSISRCEVTNEGEWRGDMTWDELMEVKRGIGYADFWAVEVYPPDEHIVNVANMRHLFLTKRPAFAWVIGEESEQPSPIKSNLYTKLINLCKPH